MNSVRPEQLSAIRLPRSLSSLETWGFGLTGHVGWIGTAPVIHAALGPKAIFVWFPGVFVSVLLHLQVQRLGMCWPEMAGGTPNYAARLLKDFPGLGRYVAIGYYLGWACSPAVYSLILTELLKANLEPLGIACPETILRLGFTIIAFVVGFSGTRALGLLHLFFVVPAITFLLAFCFQGLGWLTFSPASPGLLPTEWSSPSFGEWAKWFFISVYSVYSCESASSFVADSRRPFETLRFLSFAAWLIPLIFIGGSWVLMQLATQPGMGDDLYLNLLAAAKPFWGNSAASLVTLLITCSCLLTCATTVANTPRILYQLALDGQLAPVFKVVSPRGVLGPGLVLTFLLSLLCLIWGDISQIVMITGTSYFLSMTGLHLGLWLRRGSPEVRWPRLSLCFFAVEIVVVVVGGLAWGWQDLLLGLLFPIFVLAGDAALRRISFAPFHPKWWLQRYSAESSGKLQDFIVLQVLVLIFLICSSTTVGWFISSKLTRTAGDPNPSLLVVLLVTLSFVGVALACWTTLPQIAAIDEARQQAKNLLITTLDTVPDSVLVLDKRGNIRQMNAATQELFQKNTQELVGHHLNKFLSTLTNTPAQWPTRCEYTLKGQQSLRIIESSISQQSNRRQEYIVILRDITERKQSEEELKQYRYELEKLVEARTTELTRVNKQLQKDISERRRVEEQLRHNSFHDGLTGLPNHALFMERMRIAFECAKRRQDYLFAVLFLDLDRFKIVNDSLGHVVGNQLLIAISCKLKAILRSGDTLARWGGDEFTILLEDVQDINTPIHVAERIQKELALPFKLDGNEVFTSTSIGIALSSPSYEQLDHILRDADIAMYRAKAKGKGCHEIFNPSMHTKVLGLLHLENDLRRAIEQQEFQLYYQPIVSLATGKIDGFEALIRWQHPERGLISPLEFIPVAEETGLIIPIGNWVLQSACRQMCTWQRQFPGELGLNISVNLSAKQFSQPNLVEQVCQILHETELNAQSLKLEITESVIMENPDTAALMLSQLRSLGIELYIDDFGTGYSSLNYIQQFQVDALKIDRSFISRMCINSNNLQLVQGIITLARNLGMDVVAEGVETQEQLAQLRTIERSYGYGQGYLFSKPVDSERAAALIARQPQW